MSGWLAAGQAAAGIAGSLINAHAADKNSRRQRDTNLQLQKNEHAFAEKNNQYALLNKYSGDTFQDYLTNYAFKSPGEQGQFAREQLEGQFPELNPWELAGTSAAGVAGAMGQDANANAQQAAQGESQMKMETMRLNNQREIAAMQAETSTRNAIIQSGTSQAVAAIQAGSSKYSVDKQTGIGQQNVELAKQKFEAEKPKINAEIQKISSDTKLSDAQRSKALAETATEMFKRQGIIVQTEKLQKEIENMQATSQVGKTIHDGVKFLNTLLDKFADTSIDNQIDKFKTASPPHTLDPRSWNGVVGPSSTAKQYPLQ